MKFHFWTKNEGLEQCEEMSGKLAILKGEFHSF